MIVEIFPVRLPAQDTGVQLSFDGCVRATYGSWKLWAVSNRHVSMLKPL